MNRLVLSLLLSLSCSLSSLLAGVPTSGDPTADLIRAVEEGDAEKVSASIRAGGDIHGRDRHHQPILNVAVSSEHAEVVRILIAAGADATEITGVMWLAAYTGNDAIVRLLLDAGANVDARGGNPWRTPLLWAVDRGWPEVVRTLLDRGADLNAVDPQWKQSALSLAADLGRPDAVRTFLARNAEVDSRDRLGATPLMKASAKCNFEIVELLLGAHADWSVKDNNGSTPLALAVENECPYVVRALEARGATDVRKKGLALLAAIRSGRLPQVRSLLRAGADPNTVGSRGTTPLALAVRFGYDELVDPLLRSGADANASDEWHRTPLIWAAATGRPLVVKTLLDAGVDLELKDDQLGRPALQHAIAGEASLDAVRGLMRMFREAGRAPSARTPFEEDSWKARLPEIEQGRRESARLMIAAHADLTARGKGGETALVLATANGATAIVADLIHAHPNLEDQDGDSALAFAACIAPIELLQLLLDAGARGDGLRCIATAQANNDVARLRLLIRAGADVNLRAPTDVLPTSPEDTPTLLMLASRDGQLDIVRELLAGGAEVDARWKWGGTALTVAAGAGWTEIVNVLLQHGASIEAIDGEGRGPLAHAAAQGHAEVVRALLAASPGLRSEFALAFRPVHGEVVRAFVENGVDLETRDDAGRTPVFWAIRDQDSVEILLQAGAKPNVKDTGGMTPLLSAIEIRGAGGFRTAPLLIEAGADLNARDATGQTPLLFAVKKDLFAAARLLIDAGADLEIPDNRGTTPMQWAIDHCDKQLIQHLWKIGRAPWSGP